MNEISLNRFEQMDSGALRRAEAMLSKFFPKGKLERVLLVTPPDADASLFRFDTAKRGRYTNYPPYGLLLIAQHLRDEGVDVRICNLNDEILQQCRTAETAEEFDFDAVWQDRLDAELDAFDPDLVGVTCMFTMTHGSFKNVCERIGATGRPVAVGGVHVTNDVERVLDDVPAASIAFLREGDMAIKTFAAVVGGKTPVEELSQVILDSGGERLRFLQPLVPGIEEIDTVPAYDLIDVGSYSGAGTIGAFYCFKPKDTKFATVLSNRGCRAQCTFCSVRNFNGTGVRQRSVGSVIDELKLLKEEHGIEHIMWLDDDLLKDHARAVSLFNEMVRHDLNLTWDATNGVIAKSCTEEVISAAAESGCIALNIGMESGNRDILRSVRKPGTVETFLAAAEVLRNYDQIHSSVFLMVGFPGETMEMVFDTISVARQMDLDWYRVSQLQPLPNTPLYDAMVAQGLIQQTGSKDLRFNGGAYGKQTEIEQGRQLATPDFREAFANIPLDAIPTPEQLTDIWFFMNYHLNFHRIFHESNPVKIDQLIAHLNVLADVISPENGFALYFLGVLQHRKFGAIEPKLIERLKTRLATSSYWQDRFDAFGLSVEDLESCDFSSKSIGHLLPSQHDASAYAS